MNLVDKFLETATDEFGNKIDFSTVEVECFNGSFFLGKNEGYMAIDEYGSISMKHDFTILQEEMTSEFIEYVKQKMKEHKDFVKDQIKTQNSLK